MEKIKTRSMKTFVLSSFINVGIGLVLGLIVGILFLIIGGSILDSFSSSFYSLGFADQISMAMGELLGLGAAGVLASVGVGVLFASYSGNIYRAYFFYALSLDINSICEGDGKESDSFMMSMALSVLTFGLYQFYWLYKLANRLKANAPRYGYKMPESGKDIVILNCLSLGFIGTWEIIKNMNRIADVYNRTGLAEVSGGVN